MSEKNKEKMLELLSDQAIFGLSDEELAELAQLEKNFPELTDDSLELAAATIGMMNLDTSEPMPAHLRTKIEADAEKYFTARRAEAPEVSEPAENEEFQKTFTLEPKKSVWSWLGWAVAAAACIVLAVNIYTTRVNQREISGVTPTPTATPAAVLTPAQQRAQLLSSVSDVVQTTWGDADPKKPLNVEGDIVWSNSAQKGFIRFRNLPANDKTKEQYQLWIFDETQKYPVDGGVFDSDAAGEIVIPIDAKIKVQKPVMFAVTAEKPGGVVVSAREKIMAIAKVAV
jgi:anti-sigma-K factor RskA